MLFLAEIEICEHCQGNTHNLFTKICNREKYLFETNSIICMVHKGMYMEMGSPFLHYMDMGSTCVCICSYGTTRVRSSGVLHNHKHGDRWSPMVIFIAIVMGPPVS